MVLSVVVAGRVALLFILVMGADTCQWTRAGPGHRAHPNPGEIHAGRVALHPDAKSNRWP